MLTKGANIEIGGSHGGGEYQHIGEKEPNYLLIYVIVLGIFSAISIVKSGQSGQFCFGQVFLV